MMCNLSSETKFCCLKRHMKVISKISLHTFSNTSTIQNFINFGQKFAPNRSESARSYCMSVHLKVIREERLIYEIDDSQTSHIKRLPQCSQYGQWSRTNLTASFHECSRRSLVSVSWGFAFLGYRYSFHTRGSSSFGWFIGGLNRSGVNGIT
jgi:hypothetical protein